MAMHIRRPPRGVKSEILDRLIFALHYYCISNMQMFHNCKFHSRRLEPHRANACMGCWRIAAAAAAMTLRNNFQICGARAADTQHCQVVFAFMKKSIQYRVSLERKQCECLGQLYYVTLRSGSPLRNATYLNMNCGRVKSNQALIGSQGVVMLTILSIS